MRGDGKALHPGNERFGAGSKSAFFGQEQLVVKRLTGEGFFDLRGKAVECFARECIDFPLRKEDFRPARATTAGDKGTLHAVRFAGGKPPAAFTDKGFKCVVMGLCGHGFVRIFWKMVV